jgi:predicted transcriptional regulator of viral defense system
MMLPCISEGNSVDLKALLARYLRELDQPVITDYDLSMALFHFHSSKKYRSEALDLSGSFPPWQEACATFVQPLIDLGILCPHKDFPEGRVFTIIGNRYQEPGDIACSVDPFAYLSHLSAMEYHGLTNRLPKLLFISTPPPKEWSAFAAQKMEKDGRGVLSEELKDQLPRLVSLPFDKIHKTQITRYASIHRGAFKNIEGRKLRVSTIGRTFLDMLRKPDYCGGMRHVMEIFGTAAGQYRQLIIDELDRHGNAIEKARAGFLLEEYGHIQDEKINEWAKHAQRGGSRKLNPEGPFRETYSERWCLSLNVD